MDLPEAGSTGKAPQVQVMDDIPDLSWYGYVNNGGGTDGQEYQFQPFLSILVMKFGLLEMRQHMNYFLVQISDRMVSF